MWTILDHILALPKYTKSVEYTLISLLQVSDRNIQNITIHELQPEKSIFWHFS